MSSPNPVFQGMQFLEYFTALVTANPRCQVRIVSYLINYESSGVLYDLYKILNQRPSIIHVGRTHYVPELSVKRELKAIKKDFPNIKTRIVLNDHRKIFYFETPIYNGAVRVRTLRRAWIGSQNLCESRTKNLVIEVPESSIDSIRLEIDNLKP